MPDETKVVYVKATSAFADADYGKVRAGRVMRMTPERAQRFLATGLVEESDEGAFKKAADERADRVNTQRNRAGEFAELNQQAADDWDTSTTRDVTMAPEEGLRRAYEQGRLVNTALLRDKDGLPLPADASFEQIVEARKNLGFNAESPLTYHERSSVQGGGPHTVPAFNADPNEAGTLTGAVPLNSPLHKLTSEQVGNAPAADGESKRASERGAKGREAKK